jgi:tRNA pseudouridine38-40 synthase
MPNIKLTIAYDGTGYLGWQKTKEGPSIEETLQKVLERILQEPITLQAASRTDAGVHAQGQVVNFISQKSTLNCSRLCISLNSLLPKDVVAIEAQEAAEDYHPTLHCSGKIYHYWIDYGSYQLPQHRFYAWHLHHALDIPAMRQAAGMLRGRHDFSAFCNVKKNEDYSDHIRVVEDIAIIEHPNQRLQVIVSGNHFLYKMVRNIVGTVSYVGMCKLPLEVIPKILEGKDRTRAGVTAPAHGLTLYQITSK